MKVLWYKLARELWLRKGSLLALVAIVTIGEGCLTGLACTYFDMDLARERFYRENRLAHFTVDFKRAPLAVLEELRRVPNVAQLEARISLPVRVEWQGDLLSGTVHSLPARHQPLNNALSLTRGGWFSLDGPETILNEAFARAHELGPGSRLRVLLQGQERDLTVVGRARSPEYVYVISPGSGVVPDPGRTPILYAPFGYLQEQGDLEGACNQVLGTVVERNRLSSTLTILQERLQPYGVLQATVDSEQSSVQVLAGELQGLKISSTMLPAICLAVAALVLNVVVGRMVAQQRVVIGTLRALGYTAGQVAGHYLMIGLCIGGAGAVGGLLMGMWLQRTMVALYAQFYELPSIQAGFYPHLLALGVLICLGFACLGTLGGARSALRLEPAESMRPAPPEIGGSVLLERWGWLWRRLSFGTKMVIRSLLRNPFRCLVTAFGSAMATALMVEAFCLGDSIQFLNDYEFRRTSHQDVTVSLRDPRPWPSLSELAGLPGVEVVEGQLSVGCDLSLGAHSRRVSLTGLAPDARLYTPLDQSGHPVRPPDQGLVLSSRAATVLQARVGSVLRVRPLVGERRESECVVTQIVDTYLGMGAYCDLGYLSRLIGEEKATSSVLLRTSGGQLGGQMAPRPWVVGMNWRLASYVKMKATLDQSLGTSLGILSTFAALLAFGSVLNLALVSLSERSREVGTFRVLGLTPAEVARIFILESYLLNGLGILAGLPLGAFLVNSITRSYDTDFFRFPTLVPLHRLLLGVVLMLLFISLAQWVVLRMVRAWPWLDALKVRE
ncbi:MAG: ABC transporter permease [Candidatus Eremiobacteraeota bacterium]|nr:ABC transporter permease [Candidatus Eremiobacteraeota bacterium]MCW5869858.1 ABC transporter permease [Candidatus Eremiobacteraeota bacterium]